MPDHALPRYADVAAASAMLRVHAVHTPVITSPVIDQRLGAQVYFKCENLQRSGSFKFRDAFNALQQLDDPQKRTGVVAFSSGNHALAVAQAARGLHIPAVILMPDDAPGTKIAAVKAHGCEVVLYDRLKDDRDELAQCFVERRGLTLIHPFDDAHVIAGQGSAAFELFEQVAQLDALFVPVGGGGLLAGTLLVVQDIAPGCRVIGVEPETGNDMQMSLRVGARVRIAPPHTVADGARATCPGAKPFDIIRELGCDLLAVSDAALVDAVRFCAENMKMIVEPTGCLGLAGVLAADAGTAGRIGVILTGGNTDLHSLNTLLQQAAAAPGDKAAPY